MEFKKILGISEKAFVEYQTIAPDHTLVRKIAGTLLILVGVGLYVGRETGIANTIYTIGTVSLLYVFLITFANRYATGIFSRRNYRKNNIQSVQVDTHLNHDGIKINVNDKNASYRWEQFKDIIITNNGYYFYATASSALIIDRTMINQKESETINKLIQDHKVDKTKLKQFSKK
jgi:hypothetical protein